MSGGHFDYSQHHILEIAEEIDKIVSDNNNANECEFGGTIGRQYRPDVIARFQAAAYLLRASYAYAHRIDWLLSGDDGEDCFISRLNDDLAKIDMERKR